MYIWFSTSDPLVLEQRARKWHESRLPIRLPGFHDEGAVTVVVFSDFQCPFCAAAVPRFTRAVEAVRAAHGGRVELVVMDFPLEPECNPASQETIHAVACEAAAAVRLVSARLGKHAASEFSSRLYDQSQALSLDRLGALLAQSGLDSSFKSEYKRLVGPVSSDARLGEALAVREIPALFVNGRRSDARSTKVLMAQIEYELLHADLADSD